MIFRNVCIEAMSYVLPESIVSSTSLEEHLSPLYTRLKWPLGTLEKLSGVRERRLWPIDLNPSSFASKAGEKVLNKSEWPADKIDLLIYAGVCRDYIEPATAMIVHHLLKLSQHCISFDLSNACVGFLNAILVGAKMIECGQVRSALIVSGENAAPLLENTVNFLRQNPSEENYRRSLASLTLGSAAVGCLLMHQNISQKKHKLQGGVSLIASEHHGLCLGQGDYRSPLMRTDSTKLFEKGIDLSLKTWVQFLDTLHLSASDFAHVFTHQVSLLHQETTLDRLGISQAKMRKDCQYLGNTGSVAAPLSLALAEEASQLKTGENLALLGIGSGLNTIMLGIQW